jgi:hypothetical protein
LRRFATSVVPALLLCAVSAQAASNTPPTGRSHCTGSKIRGALVSFTHVFNRGDDEGLDALVAPEPDFQWYSTPGPGRRLNVSAKRRDTLDAYFRRRHAADDRLRLTDFSFNGNGAHWGNFSFTTRHSAGDFRGGKSFVQGGKGAAVCDDGGTRFIVLTFGNTSVP